MRSSKYFFLISFFLFFTQFSSYSQNYFENSLLHKDSIAPNFNLVSTSGDSIHLSDYKGKIIILDFWYVGCRPCIKAYNDLKALEKELGKEQFVIIGMNPVTRKRKIKRYIKKGKYSDIVTICSKEIKNQYRVKAYPTIYVIDKQGKIALATAGYYDNLKNKLKNTIIEKSIKDGVRKFL